MEMHAGAFIVIEGIDGSGKSTQFELLKKRLEQAGHNVAIFKFPQYDLPSSYFAKNYLQGRYGNPDEVGPYTSSLFYALDRFEAATPIRQALQEGKIVLCDRFTGSNMAHQGTKLAHAEERRGFFIWLDNLEFEMLRVPRPNISFVLRVPPNLALQALSTKQDLDIHERDRTHIERTAMVYDDMVQLFPKDFQRIDCVRDNTPLDADVVHAMLWEKVRPLLPEPAPSPLPAATPANPPSVDEPVDTNDPAGAPAFTLDNASGLLVQKIERLASDVRIMAAERPDMYLPESLVPNVRETYQKQTAQLCDTYQKLCDKLQRAGHGTSAARSAVQAVMPIGAATKIHFTLTDESLETLVIALLNDELPEAKAAGTAILAQALRSDSARQRLRQSRAAVQLTANKTVRALAEELLTQNHIGEQPAVQLVQAWPRNELDLVPDMLYAHAALPLRAIEDRVARWTIDQKLAVLEAYCGDAKPGPVLEKAQYSWDLLTPYSVFRELQRRPLRAVEAQDLTPRNGYDIPKIIEDADLSDLYESCFDLSLTLFSTLQQAGHHLEAQYAVLYGHNVRWKMTCSAAQMSTLPKTDVRSKMYEKVSEVHPTLSETLQKTPHN